MQNIHHAADSIFGQKDWFSPLSESANHSVGFRSLRHLGIKMEIARANTGGIFHCYFCRAWRFIAPFIFPFLASRIADRAGFQASVKPAAGKQKKACV